MYERAGTAAAAMARRVTSEQQGLATPCSEWNVHALLAHMALGPAYLLKVVNGDGAGPSWPDQGAIERCVAALRAPGALERRCVAPTGLELSVAETAAGTAMDQLVHTWDLAVATGGNRRLDAEVVEAIVTTFLPRWPELSRRAGFVGPEIPVGPGASSQDRLLGAMGRNPGR
jgi:uncharacterized protein (TIGR03086 family)